MGGNEAINKNPFIVNDRTVAIHITRYGSDWYWACMSLFGFTALCFIAAGYLRPVSHRIFHYISVMALSHGWGMYNSIDDV
jgi:bacteriorhodopsin